MGLEVRFIDESGKECRSSPARDVAYFWPQLVSLAGDSLKFGKLDPWLEAYLEANLVGDADLRYAIAAYYKFCELALDPTLDSPQKALEASGFLAYPPAVQVAVCAKLGQIVTGAFWAGIRSSNPSAEVPPTVAALREHAKSILEEPSVRTSKGGWLARLLAWLRRRK